MLVIIWVWAHVWEGLIDRVERDQLSRPEWCAGDDAEPLIGQPHLISPLIGRDQHISTGNDSIKNLYNLVGGTVGTLLWWYHRDKTLMDGSLFCVNWGQVRSLGQGNSEPWDTDTGWKLVTPHSSAQSLSRLETRSERWPHDSAQPATHSDICREKLDSILCENILWLTTYQVNLQRLCVSRNFVKLKMFGNEDRRWPLVALIMSDITLVLLVNFLGEIKQL